jgi:hypothetical protein
MRPHCLLPLLLGLGALPALGAPPNVGYAQATGYFKKDSRPTLYQPLHLLDGRELTAWCASSADVLADSLTFGFRESVSIDEVRIYTGNGFDDASFREFSRGKSFALKGPEGGQRFTVSDARGPQTVTLQPPVEGAHFTLEVLEAYHAEDPEAPVCITDIVFVSRGKALNGHWLTPRLKYERSRAPLLGTWFGGDEGAPDHFLAFFVDGTYQLLVDPYDPEVPERRLRGTFQAHGDSVVLEVAGRGRRRVSLTYKVGADGTRSLALEGEGVPPEFLRTWRSHR